MAKRVAKVPAEECSPEETGVAYSVRSVSHQGFSNFEIVTWFIVNGKVVHSEASQNYAMFEAIARLEILISASTWNLSHNYLAGRLCRMGSEQRQDLVKKLEREGKEDILKRIKPALEF